MKKQKVCPLFLAHLNIYGELSNMSVTHPCMSLTEYPLYKQFKAILKHK